MVVACIALTVALGGTSYAALTLPRNSVGTKQLKKNAVTTLKVKNNAITSPKVKNDAITSPKVKNNAITGADVLESSLGQVPSAASAVTAVTATTAGTAAPSGPAGGSLAGTYPAPSLAADAVTSAAVINAAQATGLRKADIGAVSTTVVFDPPNIGAGLLQLRHGNGHGSRNQRRRDRPSGELRLVKLDVRALVGADRCGLDQALQSNGRAHRRARPLLPRVADPVSLEPGLAPTAQAWLFLFSQVT